MDDEFSFFISYIFDYAPFYFIRGYYLSLFIFEFSLYERLILPELIWLKKEGQGGNDIF